MGFILAWGNFREGGNGVKNAKIIPTRTPVRTAGV